jgi:hypothetical protein
VVKNQGAKQGSVVVVFLKICLKKREEEKIAINVKKL